MRTGSGSSSNSSGVGVREDADGGGGGGGGGGGAGWSATPLAVFNGGAGCGGALATSRGFDDDCGASTPASIRWAAVGVDDDDAGGGSKTAQLLDLAAAAAAAAAADGVLTAAPLRFQSAVCWSPAKGRDVSGIGGAGAFDEPRGDWCCCCCWCC